MTAPTPPAVLGALYRAGVFNPARGAAWILAISRWGPTLASLVATTALTAPRRAAVIDDAGYLDYRTLDRTSTAMAGGLRALGLGRGTNVGVLHTNGRGFVEVVVAAAKADLVPVLLSTGFAAPQLAEVLRREQIGAVVCTDALADVLDQTGLHLPYAVTDEASMVARRTTRALVRSRGYPLPASLRPRPPTLLTSGTTGSPKGARRNATAVSLTSATALLQRLPYRVGDIFVVSHPLFHAWGFFQLVSSLALGATLVLPADSSAASTLEAVATHRANVLAVVPVLLQRMLGPNLNLADYDLSTLRIVASSGSALPVAIAQRWMDQVGDNLYNVYGSTEVGHATLASPTDLRAAPGTVGRALPGCVVEVLDEVGHRLGVGEVGRIFVGGSTQFAGYTDGGARPVAHGLIDSGDVGYFDAEQRLFVTGRSDDMIVSGGENVYPAEVEELLLSHPGILEASVTAAVDEEFGQRLVARVVASDPALDERAVKRFVAEQLARHKVPRTIEFVGELPRTLSGKVRRHRQARS